MANLTDRMFRKPIPGQSWTTPPGNFAWERPPKTTNVEEAIDMHLDRLSNPEVMEGIADMLEIGFPMRALTETIMTSAVASGIHSIDVGLIIAPVVHEQLKVIAAEIGVEYDEGFDEPTEKKEATERARVQVLLQKEMQKSKGASKEVKDMMQAASDTLDKPEAEYTQATETAEAPVADTEMMPAEAPAPAGQGLMSRRA